MKEVSENSQDVVLQDRHLPVDRPIRKVIFLDGNSIDISLMSANVDVGMLSNPAIMRFYVGFVQGQREAAIVIEMDQNQTQILPASSRFINFTEGYSTKEDPLNDKVFLEQVKNLINGIFSYVN